MSESLKRVVRALAEAGHEVTPHHIFPIAPKTLIALSGATKAEFK